MPASVDAVAAPEPRVAGRPTATIRVGLTFSLGTDKLGLYGDVVRDLAAG
jgi:hypothetical protein